MTREEETVCIQRICAGDANAFEPLVLEYQTSIYHLVYRIVQDSQDATDLTQEIFLQAYRSLSSFRGESRFFVWLYRLACNCCTDFLRKKSVVTVSLTVEENSGEFSELEIPDLRFHRNIHWNKKSYEPPFKRFATAFSYRTGNFNLAGVQRLFLRRNFGNLVSGTRYCPLSHLSCPKKTLCHSSQRRELFLFFSVSGTEGGMRFVRLRILSGTDQSYDGW